MGKELLQEEQAMEQHNDEQEARTPGKKESKSEDRDYKIRNHLRAGQIVFGITGKPVKFDSEGVAVVSKEEFDHFKKLPHYSAVS